MEVNEIISALRRMKVDTGSLVCFGCGHEHNCGVRGCAILREAADTIERLNDFDQTQSRKMLVKLQKAQEELDEMKRSGWISVKDRMPDDGEGVLALVSGKYGNATFESAYELAEYSKKEGWILCYFPEFADPDVSHWMPLPEPPKEDEA